MKISAKILSAFLPLVVLAAGAGGLLTVRAVKGLSHDLARISRHVSELHDTAAASSRDLTGVLESKLRRDYEYLGQQMAHTLALTHRYLEKEMGVLSASTLLESYLTAPAEGRFLLRPQIESRFASELRHYDFAALVLRDPEGRLLLHMTDAPLDAGAALPDADALNPVEEVCRAPWFAALRERKGFFLHTEVVPRLICSGTNAEPAVVLVCPLRYKRNHYDPEGGETLAWLCASMRLKDFCAPLLEEQTYAPARLAIADAGGRTLMENASAPGPADAANDALHVQLPVLDGQLVLHLHASRDEIRRNAALAGSMLSTLRREADDLEALAREQTRQFAGFWWRVALAMAAVLVLALAAGVWLARRLTAPLRQLSASAGRIAAGHLDEVPRVAADDEIGELGRNFDRMRLRLKDHISHLDGKVTEKTQALVASENAYRLLFTGMTDGFALHEILCDADGRPCDYRFLDVNPAFEQLTGLRAADILGKTAREVLPGLEAFWVETYGRVALGGEPARFEHYSNELKRAYVVSAYSPQKGRFATLVTDVTERQRAEEERRKLEQQMQHAQKLESLGVLAGGIAHDFNNLLMAVLGNADLALSELPEHSPARENLVDIEKAARRAADLCRQMLAYSGKGRFVIEPVNLNEIIAEMSQLLEVSISKSAALRCHFAPDLPAVEADATQLRQIVMNLLTNASEALGERSGTISLTTGVEVCGPEGPPRTWAGEKLPGGPYVFLEVSDTGCGMDKETVEKIFDPFFTTKFTGRGLGLAAVLGIVRGHRGAMRVYSEPGQGTTFKILLPAVPGPARALHPDAPAADWRGSGLVLLVDDEETVRTVGERMLRRAGFDVRLARDGQEALECFRAEGDRIRCVLLDLTMPRMNGEECFRQMRALRPDVRVVLSSGYNEQDAVNRFAGKGLAGFLQKPYHFSRLLEVIRAVFEAKA